MQVLWGIKTHKYLNKSFQFHNLIYFLALILEYWGSWWFSGECFQIGLHFICHFKVSETWNLTIYQGPLETRNEKSVLRNLFSHPNLKNARFSKTKLQNMSTSRDYVGMSRVTSEIDPENINDMLKIAYSNERPIKLRMDYEIQARWLDVTKFGGICHAIYM